MGERVWVFCKVNQKKIQWSFYVDLEHPLTVHGVPTTHMIDMYPGGAHKLDLTMRIVYM